MGLLPSKKKKKPGVTIYVPQEKWQWFDAVLTAALRDQPRGTSASNFLWSQLIEPWANAQSERQMHDTREPLIDRPSSEIYFGKNFSAKPGDIFEGDKLSSAVDDQTAPIRQKTGKRKEPHARKPRRGHGGK